MRTRGRVTRVLRWLIGVLLVVGGLTATWAWGEVAQLAEPEAGAERSEPTSLYALWQPAEAPRPTLFCSDDGGASWRPLDVPGEAVPTVWAAAPLATAAGQPLAAALADGTLLVSEESGEIWHVVSQGAPILSLAWDDAGVLYAGTAGEGVYRVTADGSPEPLRSGEADLDEGAVYHLATSQGRLVAATPNLLFTRDQAAGEWTRSEPVYDGITALAALDSGLVYAGTEVSGVWMTADAGKTWQPAGAADLGFAPGQMVAVTALEADPAEPGVIYAAVDHVVGSTELHASAAGTFVTIDGGLSWQPLAGPEFPAARTAVELAVSPELPLYVEAVTVEGPVVYAPDVEGALAALESIESAERAAAARLLGFAAAAPAVEGAPNLSDVLLGVLDDPDPLVAQAAAEALGRRGNPAVAADLLVALEHPNEAVRTGAARALGCLGTEAAVPQLRVMLVNGQAGEVAAAAEALGRIGSPAAIDALLVPLGDLALTPRRHAAMSALESIGEPAVAPVAALLTHDAEHVRRNAASALGWIASPSTSDLLVRTLRRDESVAVRTEAAWALGQVGGLAAREALQRAAHDGAPEVQAAAQAALVQAGGGLRTAMVPGMAQFAAALNQLQPLRWVVLAVSLAAAAWMVMGQSGLRVAAMRVRE